MATATPNMLPTGQKDPSHHHSSTGTELCRPATAEQHEPPAAVCASNDATQTPIKSPPCPSDAPLETAMSKVFVDLMPTLAGFVSAERDLEVINHSADPAFANWHYDAEHAQDSLIDLLYDLREMAPELREDMPLRRIVMLLHEMRHADRATALHLHRDMEAGFDRTFLLQADSPTARHRNELLQALRPVIAAFIVALPVFEDADADEANGDALPPEAIG